MSEIDNLLRSLLKGDFSSLTIAFNDQHACNYNTAQQWAEDFPVSNEMHNYNTLDEWVSPEEREKAIANNSVWSIQWYPDTPVGFCILYASSFEALIEGIKKL